MLNKPTPGPYDPNQYPSPTKPKPASFPSGVKPFARGRFGSGMRQPTPFSRPRFGPGTGIERPRTPSLAAGQGTPTPPFYPRPGNGIERPFGPPPPMRGEVWPNARGGVMDPYTPGMDRPWGSPNSLVPPTLADGQGQGAPPFYPGPMPARPSWTPYLTPAQVLQILMGMQAPNQEAMVPPPQF